MPSLIPAVSSQVADPVPPVEVSLPYQPQFDSLRALAVLAVTSDHFAAEIPNFPVPDSVHLGPIAVRLFLILSGYFITASLRRTRGQVERGQLRVPWACGVFYWHRLLRILPPYGLFVLVAWTLNLGVVREKIWWLLTFTVNFLIVGTGEWPLVFSHLWSICVQEQFYLFWPLLILCLPRRWVFASIVGTGLAGVLFRVGCVAFSVPLVARWVLPFGSLDALAGGAALAWSRWCPPTGRPWQKLTHGAVALLALTLAGILRNGDQTHFVSIFVEPLEVGALLWLVAQTQAGWKGWMARLLAWRGLLYAGRISYGIYIYHILVAVCFDRWMPVPGRWLIEIPVVRLITLTAMTILLSAASWRFLEAPISQWRGGTGGRKPRALQTAA